MSERNEALSVDISKSVGDDGFPYAESTLTMPDGGSVKVLLYRSPVVDHGVSVQVETDDNVRYIAVMLNDGDLYQGNPEANDDSLYRFEALASDDDVKTDLELTCTDCGTVLCDIEAGDNFGTLVSVIRDHKCEGSADD